MDQLKNIVLLQFLSKSELKRPKQKVRDPILRKSDQNVCVAQFFLYF